MATTTEICNMALGKLGSFTIASIDEDSAEARQCLRFFDATRKSLLRDFDWNFAVDWAVLSQIDTADKFDYDYTYALPGNYLRALSFDGVAAGTKQTKWKIAGNRLYSDQADADEAKLEYIFDETDATQWDDVFVTAFTWYLAAAIAPSIKNAPELAIQFLQAGQKFLSDAKGSDTQETGLRVIRGTDSSRYQQAREGLFSGSTNWMVNDYGPPN